MFKLVHKRLPTRLIFQQSVRRLSAETTPKIEESEQKESVISPATPANDPLSSYDYFGVHNLFTVKMLFDSRMHLGHTVRSLEHQMTKFVFGTRFDMCILDLDKTAFHLRQALNFTAHIAYRGGIILLVCRQPSLVHMVDRAAMECGEYSSTVPWKTEAFTASTLTFGQEVRLPDLLVMVHTKDKHQYQDHRAILDAAKLGIPTVGLVDTDCNPNLITYPVPGNDDSQDSVQMFLNLIKQAVMLGKEKRNAELKV